MHCPKPSGFSSSLFARLLAALCFVGGLYNCWRLCYAPNTDEIQYLNIGEALLRGDGRNFLNATWGPLYGVASAVWLSILPRAYPREEIKILNLCVLLLVLWCGLALAKRICGTSQATTSADTRWLSQLFLFSALWVSLDITGVFRETPDLMLMAIVLASALSYLKLFGGKTKTGYTVPITIGACCAAGYYLKQSYLPVALLFLAALMWPLAPKRTRLIRVAVASAAFAALILPWILGLSIREGRPSLGGNSKFNYYINVEHDDPIAAIIDVVPRQNRLSSDATVIDFGTTYPHVQFPLHFESAAYLKGVPIRFDWKQELHAALTNYIITINLFRHKGPFVLVLALAVTSGLYLRKPVWGSRWLPLLFLSMAPFVLYPLVHIEYRYLTPYLFLGSISAWAWIMSQNPAVSRGWAVVLSCCLLGAIAWDTVLELRGRDIDERAGSFACCVNPYGIFRDQLHAAGVPDGSKVALVGEPRAVHFYAWLDPGNYRLQALITDPSRFFRQPPEFRRRVERELADRGSEVLLAPRELVPPEEAQGWRPLNIGYLFRVIR